MRRFSVLVLVMSLFLAACSNMGRSNTIAAHDKSATPVSPQLTGSMIVGEVTGGAMDLPGTYRITNDMFKGGLEESLKEKSFLAASPATAHYRIDVVIDFDSHLSVGGGDNPRADGTAAYTITSIADNRQVFNQSIYSKSDVDKGFFFTSAKYTVDSYNKAASSNLSEFMKLLDAWMPPR